MKTPKVSEEERRETGLRPGGLEWLGKVMVIGSVLIGWIIYKIIHP